MKIQNIQNYNLNKYYSRTTTKEENKPDLKQQQKYVSYPAAYYMPFAGGYSLNLSQTVAKLDKLAEKNPQLYPPNIREWLGGILKTFDNPKMTLITAHKNYFKEKGLDNCFTLKQIQENFPEFEGVISSDDVETNPKRESFITKFHNGETEYFDNDEDLAVQLIKLYWGQGFSLNDLMKYSDGCNLYYTMNKLNIPLASRDYGHILKFSDPEYNERLTKEMAEKHMAAMDKKAQELDGEPVYIKRGPMSDEQKKRISEGLKRYYEENPEKLYQISERQKTFLRENPDEDHTFERVVKKTWCMSGSENIKRALAKFLSKKEGITFDEALNPMQLNIKQSNIMKSFWAENPWAQKLFSKNMKQAWKIVKRENETFYPIRTYPTELIRYVEEKAGYESGVMDVDTKFNPYTGKSYIDKTFEPEFIKHTDFKPMGNIMASTYQLTVIDLASELDKISKSRKNKPYNDLLDLAHMIMMKNINPDSSYKIQTTNESRDDFLLLAVYAAKSGCQDLMDMVTESLDRAFDISLKLHQFAIKHM